MNIGERIKVLRKDLDYTQAEFAERIGLKPTAVLMYEKGNRNVTEQSITLICKTFNVREPWLRNGEGEMYSHAEKSLFDKLKAEYGLLPDEEEILEAWFQFPTTDRQKIIDYGRDLAAKIATTKATKAAAPVVVAKNATTIEESLTVAKQSYQIEVTPEEYANLMRDRAAYETEKGEAG